MTKEEIIKIIKSSYQQNKLFETILFNGDNQESLLKLVNQISQFLYCTNHNIEGDDCVNCVKFQQHQILDFNQVGDGFLAINKETLKDSLDDLQQSSKNFLHPKILVIANAENLKIDAANSILKFLEEPTSKTFLFLITTNLTLVLPTIKSRTKILTLTSDNLNYHDNFLVKVLISGNIDSILLLNNKLKKLSTAELIELVDNSLVLFLKENKLKLYQLGLELINDLKFDANTNLAIDHFLIKASEA